MSERPKQDPNITEPIIPQEGDWERLRDSLWNSRYMRRHRSYYSTYEVLPFPGKTDEAKQEETTHLSNEEEAEGKPTGMAIIKSRVLKRFRGEPLE